MTEERPRTKRDYEEAIERGDMELVALNTLIPRYMSNDLGLISGLEQTASPRLRVTKQATVQLLLERAISEYLEEYFRQDLGESEENDSTEVATDIKVIDIIKKQRDQGNIAKEYEAFSNKISGGFRYGNQN